MADDLKLELKQVFDAPIEKVWEAWTNPESLKQWLSPEGMASTEVKSDLKPDGKYRIVMEPRGSENPLHNETVVVGGKYLEIEKPHKVVFSWLWEGAPEKTHTTTVTVLLSEMDKNKTEVTLIHSGFADENMKKEHNMGWTSTFKKLTNYLNLSK